MPMVKGIILAGGSGTRLHPATIAVKVACPEEVAFANGWIDSSQMTQLAERMRNSVLHYVYPDRDRAQAALVYLRATGLLKTAN